MDTETQRYKRLLCTMLHQIQGLLLQGVNGIEYVLTIHDLVVMKLEGGVAHPHTIPTLPKTQEDVYNLNRILSQQHSYDDYCI